MNFIKKYKCSIIMFIVIFILTLVFPFSGDDLQWGLGSISLKRIIDFSISPSLNGRYMGNIFVMIMTKNIFIRGIFMSLTLLLINELIKNETKTSFTIIWLLILLMPMQIFKQSVVWTSGFTNYVISTLFLLISLLIIRNAYNNKENWYKWILNLIILFLSSGFRSIIKTQKF